MMFVRNCRFGQACSKSALALYLLESGQIPPRADRPKIVGEPPLPMKERRARLSPVPVVEAPHGEAPEHVVEVLPVEVRALLVGEDEHLRSAQPWSQLQPLSARLCTSITIVHRRLHDRQLHSPLRKNTWYPGKKNILNPMPIDTVHT